MLFRLAARNAVIWDASLAELDRRIFWQSLFLPCILGEVVPADARPCLANNLPDSTGADNSRVGTVDALVPILVLRSSLVKLQSSLAQEDGPNILMDGRIPKNEMEFKRIFDSYSDPVSYKQKFLDQNAFLVYYTKGYDGPGRANTESNVNERQTQQFGLRNEAWIAWDNFLAELKFLNDDDNDCAAYLSSTIQAIDSYLALAPTEDLEAAKANVGVSW